MQLSLSVRLLILCFSALLYGNSALASGDNELDGLRSNLGREWVMTKNDQRRNIKTYARLEDGKQYRSFKIEAVLDSSVEALAHVLLDFEGYTRWYWKTRESRLVQQKTPTEFIVYMVHEAPYGIPDRDAVLQGIVEPQTKTKRSLTLKVSALPNYMPTKPPLVRMPAEDMSVKFSPLPNGKVQLEAEGYFDAGGTVPVWAANFVQRSAPYAVVLGLQRMVSLDEYRKAKKSLDFPIYNYDDYQ